VEGLVICKKNVGNKGEIMQQVVIIAREQDITRTIVGPSKTE